MTKEELIRRLNEDLSAEWGTILRYTSQAGKSFGIIGAERREIFQRETQDELGHARELRRLLKDM